MCVIIVHDKMKECTAWWLESPQRRNIMWIAHKPSIIYRGEETILAAQDRDGNLKSEKEGDLHYILLRKCRLYIAVGQNVGKFPPEPEIL